MRSAHLGLLLVFSLACSGKGCGAAWLCEDTSTYYKSLEGLEGDALESAMVAVIKQEYKSLSYRSAWESLSDLDVTANGEVRLIYSDGTAPTQTACPNNECVWTREHIWPQSYGVDPEDRDSGPSYSDLHNLFPVIKEANTDRSNDLFAQITTATGECLPGFPDCQVPAHSSSSATTAEWDNQYWQPPKEKRGDIARVMFYMKVRYDGKDEPNTADLDLVEDPPLKASNDEPSTRVFGKLSALLQWHCDDPVDDTERARNDKICRDYQHNRNPFVDRESLVESLFNNQSEALPPSCFGQAAPVQVAVTPANVTAGAGFAAPMWGFVVLAGVSALAGVLGRY
mmetsp:Transcript_32803/g.80016  ORF Transcript_32803/g.80016 Transcript_32803/m.80016 type:complete len:341 (-) Transcript_32803:139-1161(-)